MSDGIAHDGVLSWQELEHSPGYPSRSRMLKGPVAVIECVQEIPCNPCEAACPFQAITVGEKITNVPRLNEAKCVGCGQCLTRCPGLAIFLVDMSSQDGSASLAFPYEYLPLPSVGEDVDAVDRSGCYACRGKVLSVQDPARNEGTAVIKIEIPEAYVHHVRGIARSGGPDE